MAFPGTRHEDRLPSLPAGKLRLIPGSVQGPSHVTACARGRPAVPEAGRPAQRGRQGAVHHRQVQRAEVCGGGAPPRAPARPLERCGTQGPQVLPNRLSECEKSCSHKLETTLALLDTTEAQDINLAVCLEPLQLGWASLLKVEAGSVSQTGHRSQKDAGRNSIELPGLELHWLPAANASMF